MRIHLLCVGKRMPGWVDAGYRQYAKRLPRECSLHLLEIEPGHRGRGANPDVARREEGARMLSAVAKGSRVVALDQRGEYWSTRQLSEALSGWMNDGRDLTLLVGGPEGLSDDCLARSDQLWSLSRLTFPHPLVRILLAEQIYRAWSLLRGHPYHRG